MMEALRQVDPDVYEAITAEARRQHEGLELIASENFVSEAVLEATGSVMTNKYSEGYPGRRYYGGCANMDRVEELARERLKELFGAEHANVQPHSGTTANIAVYMTVCKPGDTVMGMDLSHGGHLSHGHPLNFSGITYKIVPYGVSKETEQIDYEEMRRIARESKPRLIMVGASAYPRIIHFDKIAGIAEEVGAVVCADIAHIAGLIVAGLHPNPVPYCEFVSTTTHKTLRGPRGGAIMCKEKWAETLDKIVFPGNQGGPLMHIIAAKAVAFKEALSEEFKAYQRQIAANAATLAKAIADRGYRIVSGGTDNHLLLVDTVSSRGLTGKAAEARLEGADITVNKNTIPFDQNKPWICSGIRLGSPACTTRGMREPEFELIGNLICDVLDVEKEQREEAQVRVKARVHELCNKFPLYTNRQGR
jgi:glycine hydroxymethyltransferase